MPHVGPYLLCENFNSNIHQKQKILFNKRNKKGKQQDFKNVKFLCVTHRGRTCSYVSLTMYLFPLLFRLGSCLLIRPSKFYVHRFFRFEYIFSRQVFFFFTYEFCVLSVIGPILFTIYFYIFQDYSLRLYQVYRRSKKAEQLSKESE